MAVCLLNLLVTARLAYAQEPQLVTGTEDSVMVQQIRMALNYCKGNDTLDVDYEKGFALFLDGAQKGVDFCMLMTGHMLFMGDGTDANYNEAEKWLKKCANNFNNAFAMVELGLMHKEGVLGDVDFKKMTHWFKKAANLGHAEAQYAMGYYHMKGLGVNQNYAQSFRYYQLSAERGHPGGIFGLALCYEMGYGVDIDMEKATEYYKEAASMNFEQAISWLENHNIENKSVDLLPLEIQEIIPDQFEAIGSVSTPVTIEDELEGYLLIYEWSGEQIDDLYPVSMVLNKDGSYSITIAEKSSIATITMHGNTIEFEDFNFTRSERINDTRWQATHAYLNNKQYGGNNYLVADLRLYSPQLKEPGASAYMILKSTKVSDTKPKALEIAMQATIDKTELKAFPNPFSQEVTIEIKVKKPVTASLYVSDVMGRKIASIANQQRFNEGTQQYLLNNKFNRGTYLVVFDAGDQSQTLKIIRE